MESDAAPDHHGADRDLVMIGFFESLPLEFEEAALLGGCSLTQVFRHVAPLLARPGIVVTGILALGGVKR
ncbi:MAG TPA: hypothetical protein VMH26_03490 [Burkholderiales bacterium]|nr:hypothetical protein [Burkholderiales bacterium]